MSEQTKIAWCDSTLNFWEGCTKISAGCHFCYAAARDARQLIEKVSHWGPGAPRRKSKSAVRDALRYNRHPWICDQTGIAFSDKVKETLKLYGATVTFHRRRIFSLSLGDWLDDEVPIEWLAEMLDTIRQCDQVKWILCTKRPENWRKRMEEIFAADNLQNQVEDEAAFFEWLESWTDCIDMPERGDFPLNIILLTSVENQEQADIRIPKLLKIPAACRGLSLEPLLGPVDLSSFIGYNVTNENTIQRNIRLSSGASGRANNQSERRDSVEGSGETWPQGWRDMPSSVQAATGGNGQRELPASAGNGEREAGICAGSQAGLSPLQGSVDGSPSGEPQEREQAGQPPRKLGACESQREHSSRSPHAQDSSSSESKRGEEPQLETNGRASCENQDGTKDGGEPKQNSRRLRDSVSDRQQDSSRSQPQISWLIVGGESGPNARPCNMDWIRSLVAQGKAAGVATFVKQLGAASSSQGFAFELVDKKGGDPAEWPADLRVQEWPKGL